MEKSSEVKRSGPRRTGSRRGDWLQVRPLEVLTALDVLNHDERGTLRFHYVLIAVLCEWVSGTVRPADDVSDATWVEMSTISASVSTVIALAERWRSEE